MKNYSSIKDPKDIVTKEYVDNNSIGKKSSGVNAEIFNDYYFNYYKGYYTD